MTGGRCPTRLLLSWYLSKTNLFLLLQSAEKSTVLPGTVKKASADTDDDFDDEIPLPIILAIAAMIIIIVLTSIIIFTYQKKKPIILGRSKQKIQEPKISLIEKSIIPSVLEKKETVHMITQTKSLLQHIQQDVEVYMEKLRQIEDQFIEPVSKEVVTYQEKTAETKQKSEIDEKVDKLLSKLDEK